jgi:hypothetical protein
MLSKNFLRIGSLILPNSRWIGMAETPKRTPATETNFRQIGMAKTPKRTAFELDMEEESSDLELSKPSRSDLKTNPTQPALEVEEVVDDRCVSAISGSP